MQIIGEAYCFQFKFSVRFLTFCRLFKNMSNNLMISSHCLALVSETKCLQNSQLRFTCIYAEIPSKYNIG